MWATSVGLADLSAAALLRRLGHSGDWLLHLVGELEMAFKRLKSVIGLGGPPGKDPRTAKAWILAHLLMILLLEPHTGAPEVSPRRAAEHLAA